MDDDLLLNDKRYMRIASLGCRDSIKTLRLALAIMRGEGERDPHEDEQKTFNETRRNNR